MRYNESEDVIDIDGRRRSVQSEEVVERRKEKTEEKR